MAKKTKIEDHLADAVSTQTAPNIEESALGKEQKFIELYYGINSKNRGDLQACADEAGYKSLKAPKRIIEERSNTMLVDSMKAVGVDKNTIALRLKKMLANPNTKDREVLAIAKMLLSAAGETVEGNKAAVVNVQTGPKSLVVMGFGDEDVNNMLTGKKVPPALPAPETTPEK